MGKELRIKLVPYFRPKFPVVCAGRDIEVAEQHKQHSFHFVEVVSIREQSDGQSVDGLL